MWLFREKTFSYTNCIRRSRLLRQNCFCSENKLRKTNVHIFLLYQVHTCFLAQPISKTTFLENYMKNSGDYLKMSCNYKTKFKCWHVLSPLIFNRLQTIFSWNWLVECKRTEREVQFSEVCRFILDCFATTNTEISKTSKRRCFNFFHPHTTVNKHLL